MKQIPTCLPKRICDMLIQNIFLYDLHKNNISFLVKQPLNKLKSGTIFNYLLDDQQMQKQQKWFHLLLPPLMNRNTVVNIPFQNLKY